jgi:uncharacterized short protein YbdD (DUF466 family)
MPETAKFDVARMQEIWRAAAKTARLMVGMPDYDTYVEHRRLNHPDEPILSRDAFFRLRQEMRYGGGDGRISRCC